MNAHMKNLDERCATSEQEGQEAWSEWLREMSLEKRITFVVRSGAWSLVKGIDVGAWWKAVVGLGPRA